jgi:hypothetical protein
MSDREAKRGVVCGTCFKRFRSADYPDPTAALKAHYEDAHPNFVPGWNRP